MLEGKGREEIGNKRRVKRKRIYFYGGAVKGAIDLYIIKEK